MIDQDLCWFGRIPRHWKVKRVGAVYKQRNTKVNDRDFPPLSVTKKGVLPQLETVAKTNDGDNRKLVRKGDFVINSRSDRRNSCGVSTLDGSVSLINIVLQQIDSKATNVDYLNFLFGTERFADEFYRLGSGIVDDLWSTRWQDLKKMNLCLPPVAEQIEIANFLAENVKKIDSLITDIEKQIELLQEYKKSVITETVTKGLDSGVDMKDSGVKWLGEIPSAWHIHPLSFYFRERKSKNYDLREKNLLSLSYGKVIRKDINTTEGLLPVSFSTYNIVEPGDIVIRPTDLQNDQRSLRTGLVTEKGIITSAYIALAPKGNISCSYFHYLLHSYDIQKVFYNMGNGVRQGLNYSEFSKLLVIAPPSISEQNKIAEFLDLKCRSVDFVIEDKTKQLLVLRNLRKVLIYEYVTGKKTVPPMY